MNQTLPAQQTAGKLFVQQYFNCNQLNPGTFIQKVYLLILFCVIQITSNAQDQLVGFNSNGGPEGRGTAFAIKSTGADYKLLKSFTDCYRVATP